MAELIMKLLEEFVEQALGLASKCVSQNASLELACQESCSHCHDYEVGKSGSHYPNGWLRDHTISGMTYGSKMNALPTTSQYLQK